ncbi:MAG: polysaccharide biosynthesis/export family protein [Pseudomonadota bacterium]
MFRFAFSALAAIALATAATAQAQMEEGAAPLSQPQASEPDLGVPADPVAQSEDVELPDRGEGEEPPYYEIRPGDTLTVSVLEDPNLTRTVLVRPDGRISLPIAGSVYVSGTSPEELETILESRFARGFQITPTVTVAVRGLSQGAYGGEGEALEEPTVFYLMGSVAQPGPLQTQDPMTIVEALAVAGGPTPFAAKDRIQIRRTDEDGNETILLFDYTRLEDGEPLQGNVTIEDGDIIYVPERGLWD